MKTDYELIGWDARFGSKSNFVFSVCGHQTTFMFTRTRGALKENHIEAALDTDIGFGSALLIIQCCKEHLSPWCMHSAPQSLTTLSTFIVHFV